MVSAAIKQARIVAKKQIESLYEGSCTIYTYTKVYDKEKHATRAEKGVLYEDIPCRVSHAKVNPATQSDTVATIAEVVTLFIEPSINIPPGSVISVTQEGDTTLYENSGQPIKYFTHQEIGLTLHDKEA